MARRKIKLELIVSRSIRKATFKKRREGLLKKVRELAILCGVDAFIMISSPDDPEPVTWPSDAEAKQVVIRFCNLSAMERSKKMINQESYLNERLTKIQDQLKRTQRKNMEKEGNHVMHQVNDGRTLDELSVDELMRIIWLMEEKKKDVTRDKNFSQEMPLPTNESNTSHNSGKDRVAGQSSFARLGPDGSGIPEPLRWDQWFTNNMVNNNNIQANMGIPYCTHPGKSTFNDMVMPCQSFLDGSNRQMLQSHQVTGFRPPSYYGSSSGIRMSPPFANMARGVSGNGNMFGANIGGTGLGFQGLPRMNYAPSNNTMMPGNVLVPESDNNSVVATEGEKNDKPSNINEP